MGNVTAIWPGQGHLSVYAAILNRRSNCSSFWLNLLIQQGCMKSATIKNTPKRENFGEFYHKYQHLFKSVHHVLCLRTWKPSFESVADSYPWPTRCLHNGAVHLFSQFFSLAAPQIRKTVANCDNTTARQRFELLCAVCRVHCWNTIIKFNIILLWLTIIILFCRNYLYIDIAQTNWAKMLQPELQKDCFTASSTRTCYQLSFLLES